MTLQINPECNQYLLHIRLKSRILTKHTSKQNILHIIYDITLRHQL